MADKKGHIRLISTGQVAENRKARFNYAITDTYEAGLSLTGAEVKSLRQGRANITDGYATPDGNSIIMNNITIGKYDSESPYMPHTEKRPRRLLLNKTEIKRLIGLYNKEHITIVPLKLYFNNKGLAKLLIGVGQGKNLVDKRQTIKEREWARQKARIMKK
ncbi:MAG: SsrA-binding protein SmpB [Alphaproteobacteria bacterium]|nr:SsrA-binding protein SmpB [Alphaproteobacteria bacterium]MBR4316465.1 SsrA-binding protein SmpB [Alphaproteobacteria bacterium]